IFRYTVKGPGYSLAELKTAQDFVLERQFRQVPGVVDVVGFGGETKEYHVDVDPYRLKGHALTLAQLTQGLANANQNVGGQRLSLVLWLFLGQARAAAVAAVNIPLALMAAFCGMVFTGTPANLISLGAVDFGIIVDSTVIMVENIYRHLGPRGGGTVRERISD